MVWLVVILAALALANGGVALVMRQRLEAQRRLTATADQQATDRAAELATAKNHLQEERSARAAADARAKTAVDEAGASVAERDRARADVEAATIARRDAEDQAITAETRAAEAERRADTADRRAVVAEGRLTDVERRASGAEARAADAETRAAGLIAAPATDTTPPGGDDAPADTISSGPGGGAAEVLWALERERSQRTWRNSVALSPDAPPVFGDRRDVLVDALHIEVAAAREDVGAVVELDADISGSVSPAASVLALRVAQELLAAMIRRADVTTLHLRVEGADLLVSAHGVDEDDRPVDDATLSIPPTHGVAHIDGGVRICDAIS